jgi:hypothetical protein
MRASTRRLHHSGSPQLENLPRNAWPSDSMRAKAASTKSEGIAMRRRGFAVGRRVLLLASGLESRMYDRIGVDHARQVEPLGRDPKFGAAGQQNSGPASRL